MPENKKTNLFNLGLYLHCEKQKSNPSDPRWLGLWKS